MPSTKMKVISNDGQKFDIDYDVVKQSKMLKSFYDDEIDEPITLFHVDALILRSIIDFCHHHKNDPEAVEFSDDDDDDNNNTKQDLQQLKQTKTVSEWDRAFIEQFSVRDGTLFDIITAANYLDIPILLHTLCRSVIYMIRGKSSDEIRQIFKLAELLDETTTTGDHSVVSQADVKHK